MEKYILSTNNIKNVTIDKYVIMPNHIHMLIILENEDGTSRAPSPTRVRWKWYDAIVGAIHESPAGGCHVRNRKCLTTPPAFCPDKKPPPLTRGGKMQYALSHTSDCRNR